MSVLNGFKFALGFVLEQEKNRHKQDTFFISGTNIDRAYGIDSNVYNAYRKLHNKPFKSVKTIELREVQQIYFELYWRPSGCELLPRKLAFCHFDWSVLIGSTNANKLLQKIICTKETGKFDDAMIEHIAKYLNIYDEDWLCGAYCIFREHYLRTINNGDSERFLPVWINRIFLIRQEIYSINKPVF